MATERHPPMLSVVDYDAWSRGYMPPSEHILIDQLSYRGARVLMCSDWGKSGAIWIVTRNLKPLPRDIRKKMLDLIGEALDLQLETGSESASGLAQCDTASPARELSDATIQGKGKS